MRRLDKQFFLECNIAGTQYYDAIEEWNNLHVGTRLHLERETDNPYDPNAVAVIYTKPRSDKETLLGYIPSAENSDLAMFLDMGYADCFETCISRIIPEAHYEQQLRIIVKLLRKKE